MIRLLEVEGHGVCWEADTGAPSFTYRGTHDTLAAALDAFPRVDRALYANATWARLGGPDGRELPDVPDVVVTGSGVLVIAPNKAARQLGALVARHLNRRAWLDGLASADDVEAVGLDPSGRSGGPYTRGDVIARGGDIG